MIFVGKGTWAALSSSETRARRRPADFRRDHELRGFHSPRIRP